MSAAIGTTGAIAGRVTGIATMRPRTRMSIAARVYLKTIIILLRVIFLAAWQKYIATGGVSK